ncbi:MAG: TolC family protein [Marinifilaceae bacterium]
MRKYIIICILMFTSIISSGQSELNNYLKIAADNNPALKQAFNEYMAALERVPQVNALPNPNIAFAYLIKPIETRMGPQEFKLGISQMFPWFGTLKTKGDVASELAKAKYESFLDIKSQIFSNVKATYFYLYFNNKAFVITEKNIKLLESIKNIVLVKVEAGLRTAADEYRIEMELNDLNNKLALLRKNRALLISKFEKFLNSKEEIHISSPMSLWEDDLRLRKKLLFNNIKESNHKLMRVDMQILALKQKEVLANKMGMPTFSIGLEYISIGKGDMNLPGDDAFVFPKIGISIPLYRGKYEAMKNEARFLKEAKDEQKQELTNLLENVFEEKWRDYTDAVDRVDLYEKQIKIASKTLSILETFYAANNSSFEDYIRMERKLLKYSLELEKAKIDKHIAISFIKYLTGEL